MRVICIIFFISSYIFGALLRPFEEQQLNYIHVLFEWEQEPNALAYNLQVSTQEGFESLLFETNEISTIYIDIDNFVWNGTYHWRVRPIFDCLDCNYGEWIGENKFNIIENSVSEGTSNLNIEILNSELLESGYVAIGAFLPDLESFIIDQNGKVIWTDANFQMQLNHINQYGNIYGFSITDYPLNTGMKANTDMDVVWSAMDENNPVDTHIIKQLPNGNYMGFIRSEQYGPIPSDNYMTQYFRMLGYLADGITSEFLWYGQKIIEWNDEHEIVWSWDPFNYFTMQDYDNYEGTWYSAYFNQEYDWMHSNAFHFDQQESVIYVSHRHLSRITKIAYPSGEVIWNMGLPAQYMYSGDEHICTDLLFSFQHNIQLMDNGDLLFFDNGNLSDILLGDANPITRIRRIKVIDNSYCKTVWQYDLPASLHGLGMGSVQELDNGNYSIYTYGSGLNSLECSVFEITPEKEMVWKATGNNNNAWYRAYKIPKLHPEAFSVIAKNYIFVDSNKVINISDNSIDFTITNRSGYNMPYYYSLTDLSDLDYPLFPQQESSFTVAPNSSLDLSFEIEDTIDSIFGEVVLTIWPHNHEYATKELFFYINLNSSSEGDLNFDGIINILDVVLLVNLVLSEEYIISGDLNNDDVINILDIVQLVNIILV